MTSDGKPYAPERFKGIVREKYIIAKQTNIGYSETSEMTPVERQYVLEFLKDDLQRQQEAIERAKAKRK